MVKACFLVPSIDPPSERSEVVEGRDADEKRRELLRFFLYMPPRHGPI
jgi:hypothetical protein